LKHRNIEIEEFSLIDYLGLNPTDRHPIPFDYGGSQRYACDDEAAGLDFGLIRLSPLYQELLAVNVTPVHDKNWLLQREDETFLGYLMLGVPDEYVTRGLTVGVMGETIVGMAGSAILALRRLDSPPEWAKQTRYRRFVAEIMNPGDLTSITGMSSGPILGFAEKEGRHYYRVIAIQSSQDPRNERIVYGCLIRSFGQNILDCMNSLLREEV